MAALRADAQRHPTPSLSAELLRSGIHRLADAEVEVTAEADHTTVEVRSGRLGRFGAGSRTSLYGERQTLAAIIDGSQSGVAAFLQGRLSVRGNIAMALQMEGLFASRPLPWRFPRPGSVRAFGVDTFYLEAGDPRAATPPIILLHGLGATNASMLPTLWNLARDHRVFAPDFPGHGESGKPIRAYNATFFGLWLDDFMHQLGIKRAVLVGNSMGGRVALEAGLRFPRRVERMVLLTPSPAFLRGREMVPIVRILRPELAILPVRLTHGQIVAASRALFAKPGRLPETWYSAFADEFLRVFSTPRGRIAFFSSARQIYLEEPFGGRGFWDRLPGLKPKTLFVWGERDRLVPARFAGHVSRALPAADSIVIPDCGHVPQYELPRITNRIIRDFLAA